MKRPSFQFYVGDWQSNNKLRRCTHAEKGIWLDVLCLMHDSEEYGILRWPLKEIAQAVGCKLSDLNALFTKEVLKGVDSGKECQPYIFTPRHAGRSGTPEILIPAQKGPLWYSSRMVRDEYVRLKRGSGTRFGDTPKPPIGDDMGTGIGYGPSTSSSPSPLPKDLNIKTPLTSPDSPARQKESALQKFDIRKFLTDDDLDRAKKQLDGKDIYYLIERYNEGVPVRGIPNFPVAAFMAWLPIYLREQQP